MVVARMTERAIIDVPAPLLTILIQHRLIPAVAIANIVVKREIGWRRHISASAMHTTIVHQAVIDVQHSSGFGECSRSLTLNLKGVGGG
jgi:hypothetical protein